MPSITGFDLLAPPLCDAPPVYRDEVPAEIREELQRFHDEGLLYCRDLRDGLVARHSPVPDFQSQVVPGTRDAKLVPFQPVMYGNKVIVDVGVVVPTCSWSLGPHLEPMLECNLQRGFNIPRQVVTQEHGQDTARL